MCIPGSHKNKGFTLIELLVVISIIGLLSSVVLASLNTARAKARDSVRRETLRSVQTALEVYHGDHSRYPTNPLGSLGWQQVAWSGWDSSSYAQAWLSVDDNRGWGSTFLNSALIDGRYITNLPRDPINREGNNSASTNYYLADGPTIDFGYVYTVSLDGQSYIIGTNLETGTLSTPTYPKCGNYFIAGGRSGFTCPL